MNYPNNETRQQDNESDNMVHHFSLFLKIFKNLILSFEETIRAIANYSQQQFKIKRINDLIREMEEIGRKLSLTEEKNGSTENRNIEKRLAGRLIEILNIYKNKNDSTVTMTILSQLFHELKETIVTYNHQTFRISKIIKSLSSIFTKIQSTLRTQVNRVLGRCESANITKIQDKKVVDPIINKRLLKYKLGKQLKDTFDLYGDALNLDYDSIKKLFFQSRSHYQEIQATSHNNNQVAERQIESYRKGFEDWMVRKGKIKQKVRKIEKLKTAPSVQNNENKQYEIVKQKKIEKPQQKKQPLKLNQNRSETKKIQIQKSFINLNEIRSQKYRKPYVEVKQVLVAGDELNYYSSKNAFKNINFITSNRKASYFMTRGLKIQNEERKKKKSFNMSQRLITE